jgi:hypothetical protein
MTAWIWYYHGKPTDRLYWTRAEARRDGGGKCWRLVRVRLPVFEVACHG